MGDKIYVAKQDTLEAVQKTVNETNTTMGKMDDPAGEESLVGLIKNIPETVPTGVVKSVQEISIKRDTCTGTDDFSLYKDYTINNVSKEKSLVVVNTNNGYSSTYWSPVAKLINNNTLRVYKTLNNDDVIVETHVQILEFF